MVEYHKVFKGEVKVSDVQEAFDDIVTRINNMIDDYNSASYVIDIDYSVGAKTLAPAGYTLTIGGLKQILKTYNNCIIGAKPFKVASDRVVITDGVLILNNEVKRLPSKIITINNKIATIYFNKSTNDYTLTKNTNTVKVCDINLNSESDYVKSINGVLNEDFDGHYKITTESKTFGNFATGNPIYPDTSVSPKFVCAIDAQRYERDGVARTYLFDTEVAHNWQERSDGRRDRVLDYWTPVNFLYLPKGVGNPYRVTNGDATKTFNVIIDKKIE